MMHLKKWFFHFGSKTNKLNSSAVVAVALFDAVVVTVVAVAAAVFSILFAQLIKIFFSLTLAKKTLEV
jgi:hypothetical protein